ncbi:MAG: hypothetical protein KDA27_07935 [Candidatus Eisenbacteria bacterium]|uniref:Uncharacterized protein n=1 Tax=Eiseniibacteriota bacterium TaxID=2212470 RepID=A0A956NE29_UNCEI|nr:hypothetical protein [Candidatus Eisenbacteria bacterium]
MLRWLSLSIPLAFGLVVAGLLTLAIPTVPTAALTRESALDAWVEIQQSDPQTLVFEKIGEKRYHFSTERFPYDGELDVVNVAIDDLGIIGDDPLDNRIAIIEVDFVDMPDEVRQRHFQSLGLWERNNTLYYQNDTDTWLSALEWQKALTETYSSPFWYSCFSWSSWVWIGIALLLILMVVTMSRKANKQIDRTMSAQDKVMEDHKVSLERQAEAIALTKEAIAESRHTNQLLGDILEELKKSA